MKRTTIILVCTLAAGMAWAQNPQIIQDTRAKLNTMQQNNTAASDEALGIKQAPAKESASKPAATPAKAVVPAKSSAATVKASAAPVKASVVSAKASAKPSVQTKASVQAKPTVMNASHSSSKAEPFAQKKASGASAAAKPTVAPKASAAQKLGVKQLSTKKELKPAAGSQTEKKKVAVAAKASKPAAGSSAASKDSASQNSSEEARGNDDDAVKEAQEKKWSMSGKRDPFISPVVSHSGGSGCSTGKKCLEIGAVNLRGVVHSDAGFIAVVTNNLNKAYFLRENDPVFNGYVVKITGDSIVFKETMQDRLGKSFTREVTKKITTPAV